MNRPSSDVSAWTTARTNGIVAATKTRPKTGKSSRSARRSCRLRWYQPDLMRAGTAKGPRDGGTAGAVPIAPPGAPAVIVRLLAGWVPGLLIFGVLRDAEHPVAHHADCLPGGTLRDRLEADLADHGRARAEHRGVDLPGPGRRFVALATGHLLVTLGGVGGVRACLGHRLQVIDQKLHSGQRLLIVEDDVPVLVEDVTAERPENR